MGGTKWVSGTIMFCDHVMGSNLDSDESLVTTVGSVFPEILHNLNHRKQVTYKCTGDIKGSNLGLMKVVPLKS